ncbi:hypothetical protein FGIG_07105 [Fasciola gigantica]|uniref:Uncharacterized protein n=1 Tax=Fasciola gigantica TaxID=46835 RepID=A0A504YXG3_FASGI|nr:hypothetical protein FGIG_07105 [Fasciola gigantica]
MKSGHESAQFSGQWRKMWSKSWLNYSFTRRHHR